jgi:hypothetical protein
LSLFLKNSPSSISRLASSVEGRSISRAPDAFFSLMVLRRQCACRMWIYPWRAGFWSMIFLILSVSLSMLIAATCILWIIAIYFFGWMAGYCPTALTQSWFASTCFFVVVESVVRISLPFSSHRAPKMLPTPLSLLLISFTRCSGASAFVALVTLEPAREFHVWP